MPEWSSTPPKEPGWYWLRWNGGEPECVWVGISGKKRIRRRLFKTESLSDSWPMSSDDLLWHGPLHPPEGWER